MKRLDRILGGVLVALSVAALVLLTMIAVTNTATLSPVPEKGDGLTASSAQPVERDSLQAMLPEGHETPTRPDRTPYSAPATAAPELGALVDRNAKDRVTADITSRIPRIRHEEDIPAVVSVLLDTEDDDTARNEAASLLRRSDYDRLTDDLIGILDSQEEGFRFRSFCVQHLWMNLPKAGTEEREKITATLYRSLDDRHVKVRREALLALVRMRDPKGEKTAVEWLTAEKADGLRDSAIRCVRELDLRGHTPIIRKYLHDENEVVRIAAIVTLSQWGDEESREAIKEAAKSDSFRLRRCAELALKRLDRAAKAAKRIRKRTTEPGDAEPEPGPEDRSSPATPKPGEDKPHF